MALRRALVVLVVFSIVALAFDGSGTEAAYAAASGDQNIDPAIQGIERAVIAQIMQLLRPEHRDNVIYFTRDRRIFVNRPRLRSGAEFARRIDTNVYVWPDGEMFIMPAIEPRPATTSSIIIRPCELELTGAFRRVWSKAGSQTSPYADVSARVFLPSSTSAPPLVSIVNPSNETAYIMLGGWGNLPGSAVDAGFQYSPAFNNWSVIIRTEAEFVARPTRFKAHTLGTIVFYVPRDNFVVVRAGGEVDDGSGNMGVEERGITVVTDWKSNGLGNILKRTTAIAQDFRNFESGSFLRVIKNSGSFENPGWDNVSIGPLDNRHLWLPQDTAGSCNQPPDRVFHFVFTPDYQEDVIVRLSP